jgi:hypothetical protein
MQISGVVMVREPTVMVFDPKHRVASLDEVGCAEAEEAAAIPPAVRMAVATRRGVRLMPPLRGGLPGQAFGFLHPM